MSEYPGFLASRRNYDVAQGIDADGRHRSGVLESSWRAGGASSAELAALAAFAPFATMMVHVDAARDCEPRVQIALALAHRFKASLIGVAGLAPRPAFTAGGLVIYHQVTEHDRRAVRARLDDIGSRFRDKAQYLKQVEWRTSLELPHGSSGRLEQRISSLLAHGVPAPMISLILA